MRRKVVVIERDEFGDQGIFGTLRVDGLIFQTGELPWRDNKRCVSCIPNGRYRVEWTYSPRFGRKMYMVKGVKGRWGIRLHAANFVGDRKKKFRSEVLGCITLGLGRQELFGQRAVISSAAAISQFERHMNGASFDLVIRLSKQVPKEGRA